jgi:hypothetical protein
MQTSHLERVPFNVMLQDKCRCLLTSCSRITNEKFLSILLQCPSIHTPLMDEEKLSWSPGRGPGRRRPRRLEVLSPELEVGGVLVEVGGGSDAGDWTGSWTGCWTGLDAGCWRLDWRLMLETGVWTKKINNCLKSLKWERGLIEIKKKNPKSTKGPRSFFQNIYELYMLKLS